jgi:hypothetical protein
VGIRGEGRGGTANVESFRSETDISDDTFENKQSNLSLDDFLVAMARNMKAKDTWVPHASPEKEKEKEKLNRGKPATGNNKNNGSGSGSGNGNGSRAFQHVPKTVGASVYKNVHALTDNAPTIRGIFEDGHGERAAPQRKSGVRQSVRFGSMMDIALAEERSTPTFVMDRRSARIAETNANLVKSDYIHIRHTVKAKWNKALEGALKGIGH